MLNRENFLSEIKPYVIKMRRDFHRYPELGFTEYMTTYKIVQELKDTCFQIYIGQDALVPGERFGVPDDEILKEAEQFALQNGVPQGFIEKVAGGNTGVVVCFDTGKRGKHVAFRFDIDALPILESDSDAHFPKKEGFASLRKGIMHACGHDGHTAIGLAVAKYIDAMKDQLTGKYTLLFQPAEEGGRGAYAMVAKGWLDDVEYFISGHLGITNKEVGVIASTATKFLASTKMNVEFQGESAHSGVEPNKGKNALLAAAAASIHLNSIPRHKDGATRINVGKLVAGSGRNVIPDHAYMEIETRGETSELAEYMKEQAIRIIDASSKLYDVKAEITYAGRTLSTPCDPEWKEIVKQANKNNPYVTEIVDEVEMGGSEDVTFMMERVQERGGIATYLVFSSPLPAGHHHPQFDFKEDALMTAVSTFVHLIDYLNSDR